MRKALLLLCLGVLLSACGPAPEPTAMPTPVPTRTSVPTVTPVPTENPGPTCRELSAEYVKQVEDLIARWDDAEWVASVTSRMLLAGPIGDLQALRREAEALTPPPCVQGVEDALFEYMDAVLRHYVAYLGKEGADVIIRWWKLSLKNQDIFEIHLDNLKRGISPYDR